MIKEIETKAKEEAEKKQEKLLLMLFKDVLQIMLQKQQFMWLHLPNDEMKGRIIGREGRNIRTLETLNRSRFNYR